MRPLHLLILDADPRRREELLTLLRGAGHHAVPAPDGGAAAEAIALPGFDLLVLDLERAELDSVRLREAIAPGGPAEPDSLEAAERRHIALTLRYTGGNKRRASQLLGISRSTLLHKVRKYGLSLMTLFFVAALLGASGLVADRAAAQAGGTVPAARLESGTLSFEGHATTGDFTGTTRTVRGEMSGGETLAAVRGWVEAPAGSLVTGNGKRDKDLNKSLETRRYPLMRFDLTGVTPEGGGQDSTSVMLAGKMTIHGVTRNVSLPATVRRTPAGLHLRSDFPLDVTEYDVGGLSKLLGMLRMQERIEVHVDLTFVPGPS